MPRFVHKTDNTYADTPLPLTNQMITIQNELLLNISTIIAVSRILCNTFNDDFVLAINLSRNKLIRLVLKAL